MNFSNALFVDDPQTAYVPPKDLYSFPPNSQITYPPPGPPNQQQNPVSSYLPAPAGPIDSPADGSFTGPVNPQFMPSTNVKGNSKAEDSINEMDDSKDSKDNDDSMGGMKDGGGDIIVDGPPSDDHHHDHHDHHHDHPDIILDHDHHDHPDIIFDHDHDHDHHHHHHPPPQYLDHPPSQDDIFSSPASGPEHDHIGSHGVDAFPEIIYDHYPHDHHHHPPPPPPPPPRKCF